MNKSSILSILVLLALSYLSYNKFYAEPKEVAASAKSVMLQMAVKEKWIDAFDLMAEVGVGSGDLQSKIAVTSNYDNVVHATGKIAYSSSTHAMCKEVDFSFKTGALNTYNITKESDC